MTTSHDTPQGKEGGEPADGPPRRPPVILYLALVLALALSAAVAWLVLSSPPQRHAVSVAIAPLPAPATPPPEVPAPEAPPPEAPVAAPPEAPVPETPETTVPETPAPGSHPAEPAPPEPAVGGSLPAPASGIQDTVPTPTVEPPPAPAQAPTEAPPAAAPIGPLSPAPDPALIEPGREGSLPIISADGRQAWRVYARPFADTTARPRIAIIVAGLGLRESTSQEAIAKLPADVTLSFTPYARNLEDWTARARSAGHEILMQVPMEPVDFPTSDPGPKALMTGLGPNDNRARLEWTLARATGYVGVMTYMGSRYTSNADAVTATAEILKARGLMILDSHTADQSAVASVAGRLGLPHAVATRFIDATPTRAAVDARLAELERFALQNGAAIGIAADYPGSIERIAAWAAGLEARGFVLAPVSALADTTTIE
jgi:hypothetical protein